MKFEINTNSKTVTLSGAINFTELETIKEFIGKDWKNWSITAETEFVFRDRLIPYVPYRPHWYKDYWLQQSPIWQVPNAPNKYIIECNGSKLQYNLSQLQK